jgi:dTDP-4-dehydrorhamnose reductase
VRVLVTGACGLLGSHVAAALSGPHQVIGTDRNEWWSDHPLTLLRGDLEAPGFVESLVADARPDLLVHCAAMANVDGCEREPARAYAVNAGVTKALVRAVDRGCRVIYIGTDGIFRGARPLVDESELPSPLTVYGRSKLHGEWEVQQSGRPHLILRTNFYGWSSGRKASSAEWLYESLAQQDPITLFDDFWFTPLYVVDFVEALVALLSTPASGIVHVTGRDRVSKYEFGLAMARAAGLPAKSVSRGNLAGAPLAATRPPDMSLDSSRYTTLTGRPVPSLEEGLARFVEHRGWPLSRRVAGVPSASHP